MNDPKQPNSRRNTGINSAHGRTLFSANIPHQIERDWDDHFAPRLAGFPMNLLYTRVRKTEAGIRVDLCCYWFDPSSYAEDEEKREMIYVPGVASPYRVKVEYYKKRRLWRTLKYKGTELILEAQGSEFDKAMIHTTLCGLQPDEPID